MRRVNFNTEKGNFNSEKGSLKYNTNRSIVL
jgi:hypothetical protein